MLPGREYIAFMQMETMQEFARRMIVSRLGMKDVDETFINAAMEIEAENQQKLLRDTYENPCEAYRNGYRKRNLITESGELHLKVPEFRYHSFHTIFFQPYRRMVPEVETEIREMYLHGISTRRVKKVFEAAGKKGVSASTVSRICARFDEMIADFLRKPLLDPFRFVFFDACYFPVRTHGVSVQRPLLLAVGVREDGERRIIGAKMVIRESEVSWKMFFRELADRGLSGVEMVITDLRSGIRNAMTDSFGGVRWQVCSIHLLRDATELVSRADKVIIAKEMDDFMHLGRYGYSNLVRVLTDMGYTESADMLKKYQENALLYLSYPLDYRKSLYTTNLLENLNSQLKKRTDVAGTFPSEKSAMRLIGSLLMQIEKDEYTGVRYLPQKKDDVTVIPDEEPVPRNVFELYLPSQDVVVF